MLVARQPVSSILLSDFPLYKITLRMLLLGENARVKDIRSRGRAGDTDARSGPEPINFRAMDQSVIEELLHRFRPRIVINLTASCPTAVLPFLLKGLPVVAIGSVVQSVLGYFYYYCLRMFLNLLGNT